MAFTCTYDSIVSNLPINTNEEVDDSDVLSLINAVNELKDYLNNSGGFNAGITSSPNWGSTTIIHNQAVNSMREVIEDIDGQQVCTCDYVCNSDQACYCDSEYVTCTCEAESICSNNCVCNHQTTTCTCEHEEYCSNNCVCNHQTTTCTCESEYNCSPNCNCNNVS